MLRQLLPLAVATFAVGTDGFVIAGLLPEISAELGVSVSVAGQLITAFALALAVSAPVLGAATSAMNRRSTLLVGLAVFTVGNAVTALGTTYGVVLGARIGTAAGAGLIGAAAFSAAAAIAPPERQGRALALVMGGLTISTALGLPIGTLIGAVDWRVTLWMVAGLGLVAAVGIAISLPPIMLPSATLRERLLPMKVPWVLGVLTITVLALAGTHLLYTYIGSAVEGATGGAASSLTIVLLAWGVGNVVGNTVAGRLTDKYPAERVVMAGLAAATVVLALSPLAVDNMVVTVVWALLWGVCVSLPVVPQQHRLVAYAPSASAVLVGLNSSAIYLGVAVGGGLGGLLQGSLTPARLGLAAAAVSVLGLLLTMATVKPESAVASQPAESPA